MTRRFAPFALAGAINILDIQPAASFLPVLVTLH